MHDFWVNWAAYGMAVAFTAVIFYLISRQYATFDTRAADLDRFIQGLWNTLNGRLLYSTIEERSIMGGHFSPIFVLLAPFLYLWEDPRVFSLVQTIGLAVAGLFLYQIVHEKKPTLAPWFILAFYLNASLHQVGVLELRRINLAVPFLAMAMYGLATKDRRWLLVGCLFALFCKENIALMIVMIGLFLIWTERDWRWGLGLIGLAFAWGILVLYVVNPLVDPLAVEAETAVSSYRGLNYFSEYGDSPTEIAQTLLTNPTLLFQRMFDADGRAGVLRLFLPLGLILPFLSPFWVLLMLPTMSYMLLGSFEPMQRLGAWYPASLLPILFASIAVSLRERPFSQARLIVGTLVVFTLIGYWQYSYAPFGGRHIPIRNEIIPHHEYAAEMVSLIPDDAAIATQSAYTPHLALRETIYLFPWMSPNVEFDYYLLDRNLKSYPLNEIERNDSINNLIADPTVVIAEEVDNIYLFAFDGNHHASAPTSLMWDSTIALERFEIAVQDERDFYQTVTNQNWQAEPGQTVRVTLYWQAVDAVDVERTISLRLASADGFVQVQQDTQPSNGARPTSWWEAGWHIRDVYYLTIPEGLADTAVSLDILLYDSLTQEQIPANNGEIIQTLGTLELR